VDTTDLVSVIVLSIVLLSVAVVLMLSHVRTFRTFLRGDFDGPEFDYRRRQYRRRMQTSAMLGILGVAITGGYVLTVWLLSGWFLLVFWCAVMLFACWVLLLALVDIWATRHHFSRLHYDCMLEQTKLQAELRRMQATQGNGKAASNPSDAGNLPKKEET
jgi:hypothetical protein